MTSDYFHLRLPAIVNHHQSHQPDNWESYFIGQIGSVDALLARKSPNLDDLVSTESFADNSVAYFGALVASTPSSLSLYMVASKLGQVSFVHHLRQSISSDGAVSFVGLSGFGTKASPIIIPHEAFILPDPVPGPPIESILKR